MGNPLKKVLPYIDPLANQATKAVGINNGLGGSPPPASPGFNPNAAPGTTLQTAPPGGPPGGGAASGLFGPAQTPAGYAPNPFQSSGGTPAMPPGGQPNTPWLGRGGSSSMPGGPPQVATGGQGMPPQRMNPQLQQQMATAQLLRANPQGQPPARAWS